MIPYKSELSNDSFKLVNMSDFHHSQDKSFLCCFS